MCEADYKVLINVLDTAWRIVIVDVPGGRAGLLCVFEACIKNTRCSYVNTRLRCIVTVDEISRRSVIEHIGGREAFVR